MPLPSRTSDPEELRLLELQLWAISQPGCVWLMDVRPYEPCRVAGIVDRLRLDPVEGYIEATIVDGTGVLVARWHLQRPTPQLGAVPGGGLVLEGVPIPSHGGWMTMDEPGFTTARFPEVA